MGEYVNVHRVNQRPAGERCEYSDEEARRLLRLGAIRHVTPDEPEADVEPDDDRAAQIRAAIEQLEDDAPEEAFTAAGVPKVDAIEEIVGYDITAQERDDVWSEMSSTE